VPRLAKLVEQDDLDEAIRELNKLEERVGTDDANSILMAASLERIRLRERQRQLGAKEVEASKVKLAKRLLSIADDLEDKVETTNDGKASEEVTNVLLLIHGIQTRAGWFEMVRHVMSTQMRCEVVPIKYDYFDIFRFLCPIGTRGVPIRKVADEIRKVKLRYPKAKLLAIAHSFGTFALMHALSVHTLELSRVILCGSVLPESYHLQQHFLSGKQIGLVNDCGTRDVWPVLAKCSTWGFGASGTFGFGTVGIRDRAFPLSHSEFFSIEFVSRYWVPFIRDGRVVPPPNVEDPIIISNVLSILGAPIVAWSIRVIVTVVTIAAPCCLFWMR
jgi:hypothetical protein